MFLRMAAAEILSQIKEERPDLRSTTQPIRDTFVHQYKFARRFAILVSLFYRPNVNLLKESPPLQQMMVNLLTGKTTYEQVWHGLRAKLPVLFRKIVKNK